MIPASCPNCAWAIKAARQRNLPSTQRWVLVTVAERVDRFNREGPIAIGTIRDDTGLSERTVQYAVRALSNAPDPLLRVRMEGKHLIFTLLRGHSVESKGATHAPMRGATTAPMTKPRVQQVHPKGARDAPNPLKYPLRKKDTESASQTLVDRAAELFPESAPEPETKPARTKAKPQGAEDEQPIVEAWNEMAKRSGMPVVRMLTPQRRVHLRARLKEHGPEGMLEAIRKLEASDFCRGGGSRAWRADFDFLLSPKKLVQIREGKFDNHTPRRNGGIGWNSL
jgi:hypothetical protein